MKRRLKQTFVWTHVWKSTQMYIKNLTYDRGAPINIQTPRKYISLHRGDSHGSVREVNSRHPHQEPRPLNDTTFSLTGKRTCPSETILELT